MFRFLISFDKIVVGGFFDIRYLVFFILVFFVFFCVVYFLVKGC